MLLIAVQSSVTMLHYQVYFSCVAGGSCRVLVYPQKEGNGGIHMRFCALGRVVLNIRHMLRQRIEGERELARTRGDQKRRRLVLEIWQDTYRDDRGILLCCRSLCGLLLWRGGLLDA